MADGREIRHLFFAKRRSGVSAERRKLDGTFLDGGFLPKAATAGSHPNKNRRTNRFIRRLQRDVRVRQRL
jgi:hypothetical protein